MPERARVVIIQETVLQYRRPFYELLRDRLRDDGVELTLVHSNPVPEEDPWKDAVDLPWAVRVAPSYVPLGRRGLLWQPRHAQLGRRALLWQPCRSLLRGSDLVIVEQASRYVLNYLLSLEQLLGRRRLALWGHGRNFQPHRTSLVAEWAKARLSRLPHWWFAYTDLSADVVAGLGYPRERITVVQNAIDTRGIAAAVAALDDAGAAGIRGNLGLRGRCVGVFIGGLAVDKRLDYVCEAADVTRACNRDFELVLAGAGPEEGRVRRFAADRPWVHYVGPRFGDEKAALLRVADVLLMPAWAGLAVLDAFAAGVPPVISASHPHPPEAAYVHDDVNGLVVDDGGSAAAFGRAVAELLDDPVRHGALVRGCRIARDRYTVEEMTTRFASGIRDALAA